MAALGLVAYDGSGSSSEDEEEMVSEVTEKSPVKTDVTPSIENKNSSEVTTTSNSSSSAKPIKSSVIFSKFFDDDEDDDVGMHDQESGSTDDNDISMNGVTSELEATPIWSKILPQPKKLGTEVVVEDDVEIGPIPPKKTYGDEELPPPKSSSVGSLTATKVQGKVRISIPFLNSLDEDEAVEESQRKKLIQPSQKGSGLFSVLPKPKYSMDDKDNVFITSKSNKVAAGKSAEEGSTSTSRPAFAKLIPDSVKNKLKRPAPEKLAEIRSKYMKKDATSTTSLAGSAQKDSDDEDEDSGASFFSLDSNEVVDPEALEKLKLPTPNFESRVPVINEDSEEPMDIEDHNFGHQQNQAASSTSDSSNLMNYIRPKRGRKEDVQIIDIKADDLRPDNTDWLKNITDESAVPVRRSKGPGGITKRKHQITYLAFEAKAREQELKNQWAQNRANRMATQNKYGF